MFGRMMNRYYYGKSGKGDYTPEDLPENRWQLFWDVLRTRFASLFKLNLMYMVVWIPAMVVITLGLLNVYQLMINLSELMDAAAAADATAEALQALSDAQATLSDSLISYIGQTLILLIPCITLTGPATAGLCYVTRNWARDEHAFIWADFKENAKANWKQGLLTSFLTGLLYALLFICVVFYSRMTATMGAMMIIPEVICVLAGILWSGVLIYIYPQMVTYELRYKDLLRNSLLLALGNLPMTALGRVLSLLPAVILVLVSLFTPYAIYAVMIYGLYYILLGFALSRFVSASITNAAFDKTLNTRIPGAQVGRGLRKEEDDEDEEEEEEVKSIAESTEE